MNSKSENVELSTDNDLMTKLEKLELAMESANEKMRNNWRLTKKLQQQMNEMEIFLLMYTQPDPAPNAADDHANVVPPDENTEAATQSTAKAAASLELEECKARINTLENLVAELIKSTAINHANSAPKDDTSPATNQDSPVISPESTDPASNESPTVASAITALQVKSKEFETAISILDEDLAQDRSTRKKTLEEMQQIKTNTGRVFSSQREMRKMSDNTDQKLSKACTMIDGTI